MDKYTATVFELLNKLEERKQRLKDAIYNSSTDREEDFYSLRLGELIKLIQSIENELQ